MGRTIVIAGAWLLLATATLPSASPFPQPQPQRSRRGSRRRTSRRGLSRPPGRPGCPGLEPSTAISAARRRGDQLDGNEEEGRGVRRRGVHRSRRAVLDAAAAAAAAAAAIVGLGLHRPPEARAVYNPLNLKGSYWETGKLYQKETDAELPSEPDELLASFDNAARSLESLRTVIEEGRLDEVTRLLRGGAVSESRLRIAGNALVDAILDDDTSYVAAEKLRLFLVSFDALDAAATAAARRASADGGLVSTLALSAVAPLSAASRVATIAKEPATGSDPRLEVLGALEGTVKSLRAFRRAAAEAIRAQQ